MQKGNPPPKEINNIPLENVIEYNIPKFLNNSYKELTNLKINRHDNRRKSTKRNGRRIN